MENTSGQYSFLEQYIIDVLKQNGLGELTEKNADLYLPQFIAEVEYRIGRVTLPKLNQEQMQHYVKLVEDGETSLEVWERFWLQAVPDFKVLVSRVLQDFAEDCREILLG